jgi:hypothetical protein
MAKKESIDERLTKLIKHWDTVLADAGITKAGKETKKTTSSDLMKLLGLTEKEAKAWLKKEPNYTTDEFLQRKRTDEDFTEPLGNKVYYT